MTDRSKLLALADAVEKLTAPDVRTDALIWLHMPEQEVQARKHNGDKQAHADQIGGCGFVPLYTASLDAAMTLVTGNAVLMHLSEFGADGLPLARVGRPDLPNVPILPGMASCVMTDTAPAAGMAIALTAAALRAQAEALA